MIEFNGQIFFCKDFYQYRSRFIHMKNTLQV